MHALGIILVWTALQVTVIAAMIIIVHRLAGKNAPVWRGNILIGGIAATLLVSLLAISPWPSWFSRSEPTNSAEVTAPISSTNPTLGDSIEKPTSKTVPVETESALAAALAGFLEGLKSAQPLADPIDPQTPAVNHSVSGYAVFGGVFLLGTGLGLLRLLSGMVLLRREVKRSRLLEDERVQTVLREILSPLSKPPTIEVRITPRLQSAATTGLIRPVVLLPAGWEDWNDAELHAVLAHELNHILRRDCLTTLLAELARVLHFYHPLMHWLANRLRLEQELAADAEAARSLGGQKRYLCILAEMALKEPSRAPLWPARAFLPNHRTFMRRIEMLKNNHITNRGVSSWKRWAAVGVIGLATVFAAGLRYQGKPAVAQDDTRNRTESVQQVPGGTATPKANNSEPFPMTYIPDEAVAAIGIRPRLLLETPLFQPLAKALLTDPQKSKVFGISYTDIEQVVWSFGTEDGPRLEPMLIAAIVRTSSKLDLETLKAAITPESPNTGFYGGQLYLKESNDRGPAFWLANETTLIYSDSEAGLKQAIDARNLSQGREKRIPAWAGVASQPIAGYTNIAVQRRVLESQRNGFAGMMGGGGRGMTPQAQFQSSMGLNPMFGPLWNEVETVVGGLTFEGGPQLKVTAQTKNAEGAQKVTDTLNAMLVLGRNMIEQNQQMIGQLPQQEQQIIGLLLSVGQELSKTIKIATNQELVSVEASLPEKTANLVAVSLVPAVLSAQDAAHQAQAKNNLKQLAIAMHNYHDVHRSLPTPVLMGPDGKTPHSWRVAILPYLDQAELYKQYRMNEPWDSEHNKTLISKIPAVFRHPNDKSDSTSTSYFALVGKNTLFGDGERGIRFADTFDGLSNTLMIVEAKRDIPWTKPEDIPYEMDRSKPLPKLGGWFKEGFLTAFGDGSVRILKHSLNKTTLHNLIERNDGNPVDYEELDGQPRRVPAGSRVPVRRSGAFAPDRGDYDAEDAGESSGFEEASGDVSSEGESDVSEFGKSAPPAGGSGRFSPRE